VKLDDEHAQGGITAIDPAATEAKVRELVERHKAEFDAAARELFDKPGLISYERAKRFMVWGNSYERAGFILALRPRMADGSWLRLLGEEWATCDNTWMFTDALFDAPKPAYQMKTRTEIAALNRLDDLVTVYRGCGAQNRNGVSWSLDRAVAEQFPRNIRYFAKDPLLLTGRVKREDIIAVKLGRAEQEIISDSVEVIEEVRL